MTAPSPCARTVTAGHHDADLLAWQAAGMKIPDMAKRLRCGYATVGSRLAEMRRAAGMSARKPSSLTIRIAPASNAVLDRLTPSQRAAWDASGDNPDGATLARRLGCHPVAARVRLFRARLAIAAWTPA